MPNLTLIIPAKNEAESLPSVLNELKNFDFNKTVILESSDTKTIESIKNFNCELFDFLLTSISWNMQKNILLLTKYGL